MGDRSYVKELLKLLKKTVYDTEKRRVRFNDLLDMLVVNAEPEVKRFVIDMYLEMVDYCFRWNLCILNDGWIVWNYKNIGLKLNYHKML